MLNVACNHGKIAHITLNTYAQTVLKKLPGWP